MKKLIVLKTQYTYFGYIGEVVVRDGESATAISEFYKFSCCYVTIKNQLQDGLNYVLP